MGFHISKFSQDNKTKKTTRNLASKQSKTNPYIIRCFFGWPKFSRTKKINCPINPPHLSYHTSHLHSPTLVFVNHFSPPLKVPGSHPWEVFHTPFSLPGFPNLEFQDVHLSYRPSKICSSTTNSPRGDDGSLPAGPWGGCGIFRSILRMEGFGGSKSSPTQIPMFLRNLPQS